MERVILHIDLDYFYAACEIRRDGSLAIKPVVICMFSGRSQDSGAVATCNYLARDLGISSGMPISEAKRLGAGKAVFLPADMEYYRSTSERIMELLENHADSFEQVSVDEAYLDVSRRCQSLGAAVELGRQIKLEVQESEGLTCSIGVAPNKLLAKIAAGLHKPDGLAKIGVEAVQTVVWPMPAGKLFSVGPKTEEELERLGLKTVGQLAAADIGILTAAFGDNRARQLHGFASGIDDREVAQTTRQQLARIATLKSNTRDVAKLDEFIDYLAGLLEEKLRKDGRKFRNVAIIAIATDLRLYTRSKTLEQAIADLETAKLAAKQLMRAFLEEHPKVTLRRAGIRVSGFVEEQKVAGQKSLGDFR
ncbi:MAG: DNA polymerase IV [Candidatus Aenigmarchaeota archaeon]|nr:DNA polymerase IV [Candidatus Aenigmarchaeota archaeon]